MYSFIPVKWIISIKLMILRCKVKKIKDKTKIIYLLGVPRHGNLGDQAIISAQLLFFKNYYPNFTVIEISLLSYKNHMQRLKNIIKDNTIFIPGGGSLGTLWIEVEEEIREIISVFHQNNIIIFPQTIYYEDSPWGKEQLAKSQQIYGLHEKLFICAREKISYYFMKEAYPNNNIYLIPDMVTYLKKDTYRGTRDGILLCLRKDKESIIDNKAKSQLLEIAAEYSNNVRITDMIINRRVSTKKREDYLENKFTEFGRANLVITDRLHGMLFSAITGTPCIALNNCSHKVKGVYQWIKQLSYIQYIDDLDNIPQQLKIVLTMEHCFYDNTTFIPYFDKLSKIIVQN